MLNTVFTTIEGCSNQIFKIKRNDTLPNLQLSISSYGNLNQKTALNLSGVTAVTFTMIDECSNCKIFNKSASTVCSSGGTIEYSWQNGDTNKEGIFGGEFELKYNDGKTLSVPTQGTIKIEILKDINLA